MTNKGDMKLKAFNWKMSKVFILTLIFVLFITACNPKKETGKKVEENNGDKPDTWIADRTIKGLIFMSDGDASTDMNLKSQQN